MTRSIAASTMFASLLFAGTAQAQKAATATVTFSIDRVSVVEATLVANGGVRMAWTTNLDRQNIEVELLNPPAGLEAVEITPAGTFGEYLALEVKPVRVAGTGSHNVGVVSRSAGGVNLNLALRWSDDTLREQVTLQFSLAGGLRAATTVVVK